MEAGKIYRSYLRLRQGNDFFKVGAEGGIRPLIAGNWKMNPAKYKEAIDLVKSVQVEIGPGKEVEVVVAPPFIFLGRLQVELKSSGYGNISLGAQDVFYEESGGYTGEVSPAMLKDTGVTHVIIGHSERRQYLRETDEVVSKKVSAALRAGLIVILCVGETMRDSYKEQTFAVVEEQLSIGLNLVEKPNTAKVVIAYQPPASAIGFGLAVTCQEADRVPAFIRKVIWKKWGEEIALSLRILYGGDVNPDNISALMAMPNIDGALAGDASLNAEDFAKIVKFGA